MSGLSENSHDFVNVSGRGYSICPLDLPAFLDLLIEAAGPGVHCYAHPGQTKLISSLAASPDGYG